jgi:hypothetical protein
VGPVTERVRRPPPKHESEPEYNSDDGHACEDPHRGETRWFAKLARPELARVLLIRRHMPAHSAPSGKIIVDAWSPLGVAWLIEVSVREYREIEAEDRMPSLNTYRRISELYGWPQTFVTRGSLR